MVSNGEPDMIQSGVRLTTNIVFLSKKLYTDVASE